MDRGNPEILGHTNIYKRILIGVIVLEFHLFFHLCSFVLVFSKTLPFQFERLKLGV